MKMRELCAGVDAICNVHWERRSFDELIPLPDGTSYNSYVLKGSQGTALIDTCDPDLHYEFMTQLVKVEKIDYIVSQHTEQDHSGLIPMVMKRYPEAQVICSEKARDLLTTHLKIPAEKLRVVTDGETISLGDRTMVFTYTPWVHWPETMCTYVPEIKCLFSCDFFGSHLATSDLFATCDEFTHEAAKRYYAEIMMPFRKTIVRNLEKVKPLDIEIIAPGHGPAFNTPSFIIDAYAEWVSPKLKNEVVLAYVSMHGSTRWMARHLVSALAERKVKVRLFDLAVTDIGKLAMALVDAATLIVGTPTVHVGPHPAVHYAAHLANVLRPKLKYAAIFGSYGWGTKAVDEIAKAIPNLKVEVLGTVMQKGLPTPETLAQLDAIAEAVASAHSQDADVC